MLTAFRVDNFKTLIDAGFEPAGLNLLLGRNNAGKTNLCHAIRFLGLTSRLGLDDAAAECTAEPWNLLNAYSGSNRLSISVSCQLGLEDEQLAFAYNLVLTSPTSHRPTRGRPFAVAHERLEVSGGRFANTLLMENNEGHVKLLHEKRFLRTGAASEYYVDTTAPLDATMLYRLYDLETNQRSNLFKRYLSSWQYYSLDPARLRNNQAKPMETTLESTGSNLSSVLFNLHNVKPRTERQLIEAVRLLEPRLDLFSFQAPDPDHVYMFFEDGRNNKFGVHNISDGTLRYLAISYLVLATREMVPDAGGCPIIMIEEPENGIYVDHLKPLLQRIEPSGKSGQFLFTSHNPYFIDLFDAALEGVFLIKRSDTHSEIVKPNKLRLQERLGKFSLGELHFRGLIE